MTETFSEQQIKSYDRRATPDFQQMNFFEVVDPDLLSRIELEAVPQVVAMLQSLCRQQSMELTDDSYSSVVTDYWNSVEHLVLFYIRSTCPDMRNWITEYYLDLIMEKFRELDYYDYFFPEPDSPVADYVNWKEEGF